MSPLPARPWTELSADFGDLDGVKYMLVVIDDYSRFPLVDVMCSISVNAVVPHLDKMFSEYGIPDVLRTDDRPAFNFSKFDEFANSMISAL